MSSIDHNNHQEREKKIEIDPKGERPTQGGVKSNGEKSAYPLYQRILQGDGGLAEAAMPPQKEET
jgi:hypothetical protein